MTRHVLRASYGTHFDLIWSSPQVNMGFISGLCGRTPACCLDQAPPGEMWADGPPCSPSGPERSTVAMVRLQVHHWVRTKTFARLRNIFKTFPLQIVFASQPLFKTQCHWQEDFVKKKVRFINVSLSPLLFSMCLLLISVSAVNLMWLSLTAFPLHKTVFGTLM